MALALYLQALIFYRPGLELGEIIERFPGFLQSPQDAETEGVQLFLFDLDPRLDVGEFLLHHVVALLDRQKKTGVGDVRLGELDRGVALAPFCHLVTRLDFALWFIDPNAEVATIVEHLIAQKPTPRGRG